MARWSAFQDSQPAGDVLRMIRPRFAAQPHMRQRESGRQFGYQFLNTVGVIAETLAQLPITAASRGTPMPCFMTPRGVIIDGSEERGKRRQGDCVGVGRVKSAVTLVSDAGRNPGEELLRGLDALLYGRFRVSLGIV